MFFRRIAAKVLEYLISLGYRKIGYVGDCHNESRYYVPSIIASDDIEEAQFTKPMLTTVGLPKNEMGKFALYLLLDRMKGGHTGVVRMELAGHLMVRNSCSNVSDLSWSDYVI